MVVLSGICAVLWGITAVCNFMAGNIFAGVCNIICCACWAAITGMRMRD